MKSGGDAEGRSEARSRGAAERSEEEETGRSSRAVIEAQRRSTTTATISKRRYRLQTSSLALSSGETGVVVAPQFSRRDDRQASPCRTLPGRTDDRQNKTYVKRSL
mmetsp:Transcript_52760/g.157949  ORF Transcript_52760/g.157949 Transcript_52760/m.157949 type:complete len:106 (+) Transcript_52760:1878-2195(+)